MLAATFGFALMGMLVKVVTVTVPSSQVVFWRNAMAAAVLLPWAWRHRSLAQGIGRRALVLRGVFGVGAMLCYFAAITRLRLGDAVLLTFLNPVLVAALSPWMLGEQPSRRLGWALVLGFVGVGLVADPRFAGDPVGVALGLGAALLAAGAYLQLRIASRTDPKEVIVLWFSALATMIALPAMAVGPAIPAGWGLVALLGVGMSGLTAQLMMTVAYAEGEAATMALYGYATPVFAYLLGWVFLGEALTWRGLAGTALVALAGWLARKG